MDYPTLDNLPDLTPQQISGAGTLQFVSRPDPATGTDFVADISGVDLNNSFNTLYKFTGKEGAVYDFLSVSFLDPGELRVYDQFGNALVTNSESDDPPFQRQGEAYSTDLIANWQAPYSGEYYVDASWHQGSFLKIYSLEIFEDADTAIPAAAARFVTSTGFVGEVGGNGTVFGTNGFQHIIAAGGELTFDPSFSRGGDIIELPGDANAYSIVRSGSSAILTGNGSTYTIPVGTVGVPILFDDGHRLLRYDSEDEVMRIGNQLFDTTPFAIIVDSNNTTLPVGANPAATARVFMESGAEVTLGGDFQAIGTVGEETVSYRSGDLSLDPSFNRGGDTLVLPDAAEDYTPQRTGSSVILSGGGGTVTIPVGTAGMALDFDGDLRTLVFDTATQSMLIGDQTITSGGVTLG